ncbi:hypothetical protein J5751_04050 [bacterium]|nr:hypothetical protein [bacterium]
MEEKTMSEKKEKNTLEKIIKELKKEDADWESKFISGSNENDSISILFDKFEESVFDSYKTLYKETNDKAKTESLLKEELNKKISENVCDKILKEIKYQVQLFIDLKNLDKLGDKTINFLNGCIPNMIIMTNPDYISDNYESFGFNNVDEMYCSVKALESILYSYTIQSLSKEVVKKEFQKISEFDETVCETYSEIYERYFEKLQIKFLIENAFSLERRIRDLSDKLDSLSSMIDTIKSNK